MRTDSGVADHIHSRAKQVFEVLPQPDKIEQASAGFHLYEQVHVACRAVLTASQRAEDAYVPGPVRSGKAKNLEPAST